MINLTIAVINTVNFGKVQLNNNIEQLQALKNLNKIYGVSILILINGYNSQKGRAAHKFYRDYYPEFNLIYSDGTVKVGPARQMLYNACDTEWIVFNDEDDGFDPNYVISLGNISDQIERSSGNFEIVVNKFHYVNADGSLNWVCPDWYIEDQILRTKNFAMYHGSSYALVGSFINKMKLPDLQFPTESDFSEDLLTALYLYKRKARAAYTREVLFVCNAFNSTLTDRVKTDAENDLDDLSGIFPVMITEVIDEYKY